MNTHFTSRVIVALIAIALIALASAQVKTTTDRQNHAQDLRRQVNVLLATDDAEAKRALRKEIAELKPSSLTIPVLVDEYRRAGSENVKVQLLSTIAQVDTAEAVEEVKKLVADETNDPDLAVALIYALGEASNERGKVALIDLSEQLRLDGEARTKAMASIRTVFLSEVKPTDASWMINYLDRPVSDTQVVLLAEGATKHPSDEMVRVFSKAVLRAQSDEAREALKQKSELMRRKDEE